jgi:hypothetical protein
MSCRASGSRCESCSVSWTIWNNPPRWRSARDFRHPSFGIVCPQPFIHESHGRWKTTLSGGFRDAEGGCLTLRGEQQTAGDSSIPTNVAVTIASHPRTPVGHLDRCAQRPSDSKRRRRDDLTRSSRHSNVTIVSDTEDLKSSGGQPRLGSIPTAGIELGTILCLPFNKACAWR